VRDPGRQRNGNVRAAKIVTGMLTRPFATPYSRTYAFAIRALQRVGTCYPEEYAAPPAVSTARPPWGRLRSLCLLRALCPVENAVYRQARCVLIRPCRRHRQHALEQGPVNIAAWPRHPRIRVHPRGLDANPVTARAIRSDGDL